MKSNLSIVFMKMMLFLCFVVLLLGCPFDLVRLKHISTQLHTPSVPQPSWRLLSEAEVEMPTGYNTTLKSGTQWEHIGYLDQGDVYKTTDQIVTVVGSNIFEAYIVISEDQLVGFYLPVEQSYSPAASPRALDMEITSSH
jgi:hypothetical protein